MRILICIASMGAGGAERQVTYLCKGLVDMGHEIHVALIRGGPNFDRLAASAASIHLVNVYPASRRFVWPLVRLFRRIRPDVVYLWQRPFDVLGGLAALLMGIPSVAAERTDPARINDSRLKVGFRKFIVSRSRAIIANSEAGVRFWKDRVRCPVVQIPNIMPFDEIAQTLPSEDSQGKILAVGRLDANKNLMTLLEALTLLKVDAKRPQVLIVGEGAERDNLRAFADSHGLHDQVTFAGHRSDVWSLMKGARLFVALSRYEGQPNVVMEAAAAGCELVLSDIPPHRTLEGLAITTFVDPDSSASVARALAAIDRNVPQNDVDRGRLADWMRQTAYSCQAHLDVFSAVLGRN